MPRVSKAQAEANHQAIEDAAGRFTVPERWWEGGATPKPAPTSQAAPNAKGGKKKPGGK